MNRTFAKKFARFWAILWFLPSLLSGYLLIIFVFLLIKYGYINIDDGDFAPSNIFSLTLSICFFFGILANLALGLIGFHKKLSLERQKTAWIITAIAHILWMIFFTFLFKELLWLIIPQSILALICIYFATNS